MKKIQKLSLNKSIISSLTNYETRQIRGGGDDPETIKGCGTEKDCTPIESRDCLTKECSNNCPSLVVCGTEPEYCPTMHAWTNCCY